jgi:hypothetical protein
MKLARCFDSAGDFPTHSATCEGHGAPFSFHRYSFKAGTPGARAVYRCRNGADQFMSYFANCEGHVVVGLLGYAK